ncbi:hypothetical protein [Limnofasciculus baicalensis]|uniref:Uncharacterized protein n=1 Tax=Limnofasciculus baicalensis BBK-W-15 TaxID=2699891 RepID=A0AAE3GW52_9CYAN|nr:hypothetical protein [Limnofasciculus baicalensis]MCP2731740.1 hypothetical protein [Limnofasciculus baicalensis BBK-W-15]
MNHLQQLLTPSTQIKYWLGLSILFTIFYSILALQQAFGAEYVIQDDARQHVFWMRRFLDSELFPHDIIANYFQSVAPLGYTALYKIMALGGIEPVLFSKLIPLFLGIVTTYYCFSLSMELLPIPLTGFISSLLLNQNLWMQDGLISGTPKAFIYPIFIAFLYYFVKRVQLGVGIAIAFLGLFYPSLVFVCVVISIIQLWQIEGKWIYLSKNRADYIFCFTNLGVAFLVLLPYILSTSEFAPVLTAAAGKTLPELLAQGRSRFFVNDSWAFWLYGRSGIGLGSAFAPPLIYGGLLLPILLKFSSGFPLAKQVKNIVILPQLLLGSGVMFFAAHAVLFKLHLPSRYTQHSLRIAIALAAGIALTLILDGVWAIGKREEVKQKIKIPHSKKPTARYGIRCSIPHSLILGTTAIIGTTLIFYPHLALKHFPKTYYITGNVPPLYKFFQQQPKDSLIASLEEEANNLPTFSQRSILVSQEYAIPYHLGYYRQFRQRTLDLIQAQYSIDPKIVTDFIEKYGIDFWLVSANTFTIDSIADNPWIMQYQSVANRAIAQLKADKKPVLALAIPSCTVLDTHGLLVLKGDCILNIISQSFLSG